VSPLPAPFSRVVSSRQPAFSRLVSSRQPAFREWFPRGNLPPGGSELVRYAFLPRPGADVWTALAVATFGGMTSYLVGRLIPQHKSLTGIAALRRHGAPALLLSWVPIIGEGSVRRLGLRAHERLARRIVHGASASSAAMPPPFVA
jgi:hypothetical protein